MATIIRINTGTYKNISIKDQVFTLVGSHVSSNGRIQVLNNGQMPTDVKKLTIYSNDFEVLASGRSGPGGPFINTPWHNDESQTPAGVTSFIPAVSVEQSVDKPVVVESDEQAMNRIATRFSILDKMTVACIASDVRALIVSGPPGVGKSFGVESQMEKYSTFDRLAGKKIRYEIVKGAMSALGLYSTLYKYSDAKSVVVFDDCDIFHDEDALNILKAALDSGKRRRIFWNTDSRKLRDEGIPNFFDFKGSVIFITNLNFSHARGKIAAHVDALQSRCHYLDLTINTERDRMLRIKQVHRDADGGLFKDYDFEAGEDQQILDYMWDHREQLSEVSMRMALKIADLVKVDPQDWQMLTENTCFKHKR